MDVGWGVDPPFRDTQKWCWSIPHEFHWMLYMDLSPWYLSYVFHVMIYVCIHHIPIISPVYVIHVFSPHYKRSDSWLIVSNIPITCYIYYICIWYDISRNISIICYTSYIHIISHYILYILYIYIYISHYTYIYIYSSYPPWYPRYIPIPRTEGTLRALRSVSFGENGSGAKMFARAPCWWPGWDKNWLVVWPATNRDLIGI
jgi:hypothetical protein